MNRNEINEKKILEQAAKIIGKKAFKKTELSNATQSKEYFKHKLLPQEREVFAVVFLTTQHRLIKYEELFFGTIDSASVYPREIAKAALRNNAAAIVLAHNHPSGVAEPSKADIHITKRIVDAMGLLDIKVLDHIIVGERCVSMAQRGLM